MPSEVLTGADSEDTRPVAGFFGKLPSTGDFVTRGLPEAFRRNWDVWLTREVAPLQREGLAFPTGGLRFMLASGGRTAAGVILPSQDSVGRAFPLSIMLIAKGTLDRQAIDNWCDEALSLLSPDAPAPLPDDLWQALDSLPMPAPEGPASGPMHLWTRGQSPLATSPDNPDDALRRLLAAAQA
ncbi:type VI secretion system-associated protein TagF [Tabrizicola sp.]|uniref:type VI secretion system-associated protein TagF n=1 Tax=Tabrizicola sp. TaxID=2005166 RepID=UPI003F31FAF2